MTEPDNDQDRAKSIFDRLRAGSAFGAGADRSDEDHALTAPLEPSQPAKDEVEPGAAAPHDTIESPADEPQADHLAAAITDSDSRESNGPQPNSPDLSAPERDVSEPSRPESPWGSEADTADEPMGPAPDHSTAGPGAAEAPGSMSGPAPGEAVARAEQAPGASPFAEQIASELRSIAPLEPVESTAPGRHPGAANHPLPRCLAVANQKGGVGKTTTTVNLGAALAELGYRVLVVDLDPQGNATTGLGVNARNLDSSVYDVILHDVPIEDTIEPTSLRNLFIVPATIDLAGAEIELVPVFSRELRLRRALESVEADFDFILIDCPPSLGLLTVNALAAAGEVLVPIQCEYYALEGLGQLLRNVNLVQANLNNRLEVSTIVLTMYDARTKLAEQVAGEVREHFGARVCRNVVPRTVRLSEAPSFGQPVITFDSSSRGAIAYRELAKEVSGGAPQRVR